MDTVTRPWFRPTHQESTMRVGQNHGRITVSMSYQQWPINSFFWTLCTYIKTTHTLSHMHNHTCSGQRILLREINKQFDFEVLLWVVLDCVTGWLAVDFRHSWPWWYYLPGSKRVTLVAGAGCHSVGVAAAGWLESGSECRCVQRAEIEEAPDDSKRRPLALLMFRQ